MGTIWELDFYSRPLLDENQKKIWEVLVCEAPVDTQTKPEGLFRYAQFCPSDRVNSAWLREAVEEAMAQAQQTPQKIRFFRRAMNNMIVKACKDMGIPAQASRRTFALHQWLQERSLSVYPTYPNYQSVSSPAVQMEPSPIAVLPEALIAEKWAFVTLEAGVLAEMSEWEIGFGEAFPLTDLPAKALVPGIVMFSSRALPLAGWMSGIEPAFLTVESGAAARLLLESGISDRWVLIQKLDATAQEEAARFVAAKEKAQGVHFLAIQASQEVEAFAGFWLLREVEL